MRAATLCCSRVLVVLALGLALAPELRGSEPLPLPRGLHWGDPPARLVDWARRSKLDQLVKEPGGNRRLAILMVSSPDGKLPGDEASMLEARFFDGRLFEVTLHYTFPGENADTVRGKFTRLQRILAARHGKFVLDGNQQARREGVVTKSMSYIVKPGEDRLLLMALTEVRDAKRGDAAAKFSVVYHNDSIFKADQQRVEVRLDQQDFPAPGIPVEE